MIPPYLKIDHNELQDIDKQMHTVSDLKTMLMIPESSGVVLFTSKSETEKQRLPLTAKNINYFKGIGLAGVAPSGS